MSDPDTPEPGLRLGGQPVSAEQAAVIRHVLAHPVTVADAGAGAGKTQTTVAAVFELLTRRPEASIGQFALITFTNKAADELTARLGVALAELEATTADPEERRRWAAAREQLGNAYVGTIHGFCRQVLRTFGYGADVARLSDVDFAGGLLYEAVEEAVEDRVLGTPRNPLRDALGGTWRLHDLQRLARDIYDDLRNCGLNPTAVAAATAAQPDPGDPGRDFRVALAELVADAHVRYAEKKRDGQKLDSTDLLLRTDAVLAGPHGPAIVRKLTSRYRFLFIDEFQDTDPVQLRIVGRLEGRLDRVLLVGDGKQSIYRFRGAGISLGELALQKTGRAPLPLSISRRPTRQLLDAYNALFHRMGVRYPQLRQPLQPFGGTLQATNGLPPITLLDAGGRGDRAAAIARTARAIRGLLTHRLDVREASRTFTRPLEPGDVALLFRLNDDLRDFERGLRQEGLDVRVAVGGRFYRRPEVVGTYRLLRFLLDYPNDVVAMQALETVYLRHVDLSDTVRSYLWYGRKQGHELTDRFEQNHPDLAARFRALRAAVKTDTVPELLGRMDDLLGLRQHHEDAGDPGGAEGLERLRELARSLTRSEQALTVGAFIRHLARGIRDDADGPELAPPDDGRAARPPYTRLMTVHAAKGLEFPVVVLPEVHSPVHNRGATSFLADEQEGLDVRVARLKGRLATQSPRFWARSNLEKDAALFEEMRIFYVAVTRAQNHVVFVGADTGTTHDPGAEDYSWQDEVLAAKPALEGLGAWFERGEVFRGGRLPACRGEDQHRQAR